MQTRGIAGGYTMEQLDDGSDSTAQSAHLPPGARGRLMGNAFCFACPGLVSRACRHSVTLLQALDPCKPLVVRTAQGAVQGQLILVPPQTERSLRAERSPFLMVDVEPIHTDYRVLAAVGEQVAALDHLAFDGLRLVGLGFLHDVLRGRELDHAVRQALSQLAGHFPQPPALDPRVRWMMTEIQSDPGRPLTDLAAELDLSVEHASRLFSGQAGLSLRMYCLSSKIRLAARYLGRGRSLTEVAQMAGFADSAHFSKVWTRCYGAPPSVYFPVDRMQVDHSALPGWIQPPRY